MADTAEDGKIPDPLRKDSPHLEDDSGVDNTSESGVSGFDENSKNFSSTESLDDLPMDQTCESIKSEEHDLPEIEHIEIVPVIKNLPEVFQEVSAQKEDLIRGSDASVAVLEIEPAVIVDPVREESEVLTNNFPKYFQDLITGREVENDFEIPIDTKPSWYDEEKFKLGQRFARNHLFAINFAETVSLYLIFSLKTALEPLIFTERSGTPFKAYQRYLSTFTRILSWYEEDPWSTGTNAHRHMCVVQAMHRNLKRRMMSMPEADLKKKVTVTGNAPVWSTARPYLLDDFRASCPVPAPGFCPYMTSSTVKVNQLDYTVTQFAFVGLAVTYPKQFGIHHASDEELEGFLHMWRTLGYLLGIKEQYNFCNADLPTIRQRTRDFITCLVKPSMREVTTDWEHMCRCLSQGIAFYIKGFTFEVSLQYVCNVINVHTPRLTKSLSLWHSFMYGITNFTFKVMCRVPGVMKMMTYMMMKAVNKAQDASPETLRKWEQCEFPYMKAEPVKLSEGKDFVL